MVLLCNRNIMDCWVKIDKFWSVTMCKRSSCTTMSKVSQLDPCLMISFKISKTSDHITHCGIWDNLWSKRYVSWATFSFVQDVYGAIFSFIQEAEKFIISHLIITLQSSAMSPMNFDWSSHFALQSLNYKILKCQVMQLCGV